MLSLPCPLLCGAGVESSRNVQCVLPWMLRPPAPSGWAREAHGPVSYVPTHAHSHIYAPFSEGESDPRLELHAGGGGKSQMSESVFGVFPPSFSFPRHPSLDTELTLSSLAFSSRDSLSTY